MKLQDSRGICLEHVETLPPAAGRYQHSSRRPQNAEYATINEVKCVHKTKSSLTSISLIESGIKDFFKRLTHTSPSALARIEPTFEDLRSISPKKLMYSLS